VSCVTHDAADDNEIERKMQIRHTLEHKAQNKILTPNGFPQEKDGYVEREKFPHFCK
jgi:hypothetical protein